MKTAATSFPTRAILASVLLLAAFQALSEDLQEERWNAYGQFTYIWQNKDSFPAAYTNFNGSPNSLLPVAERSFTMSATAFLGLRASKGAEIYFAPELISELPLSDLHGLGGSIQNGELEKNGSKTPTPYVARAFLRQTWGFGGAPIPLESGPLQLGGYADSRRFVLTAGKLTILDIFDKNSYTGDVRQQLMNMNFLTYAAYDFAADARGYSWGLAGEYYQDDWAFRLGRFVGPKDPNQLPLDFRIMKYFGDQLEIEHNQDLYGKPGKVRLLAFRNVENMGRWDDAINAWLSDPNKNATTCTTFNYGSANGSAPDLCWAPRKRNVKFGFGMSLQQAVADGVGVFLRGMKANGTTEVYSYTSTDSSISLGSIIKGNGWGRTQDTVGIGYAQNWLSSSHVAYLGLGGIDGFIGDGRISYRPEKAFEWFYNINLNRHLWFTLDFQHIVDPAYNSDRGPVNIYGVRVHAEI